ncbi:MAG: hypothetical protein ACFFDL_14390 [Promethearchaeota archaeon]
MNKILKPKEFYQKIIKEGIPKDEAAKLIKNLIIDSKPKDIEFRQEIAQVATKLSIDALYASKYIDQGVIHFEAKILGFLEILLGAPIIKAKLQKFHEYDHLRTSFYAINQKGHVLNLAINTYEANPIGFFPQQICLLKYLKVLKLSFQNIFFIPECIAKVKDLTELYLEGNPIEILPDSIKKMKTLKYLKLNNFNKNLLGYVNLEHIKGKIVITELINSINVRAKNIDFNKIEKERELKYKRYVNLQGASQVILPPEIKKSRDKEYSILWILNKNEFCKWSDLKEIAPESSLSVYLHELLKNGDIIKLDKGVYAISSYGKARFETYFT